MKVIGQGQGHRSKKSKIPISTI